MILLVGVGRARRGRSLIAERADFGGRSEWALIRGQSTTGARTRRGAHGRGRPDRSGRKGTASGRVERTGGARGTLVRRRRGRVGKLGETMGRGVHTGSDHRSLRGTGRRLWANRLGEYPTGVLSWARLLKESRGPERIAMVESVGSLSLRLGLSLRVSLSLGLGGLGLGLSLRMELIDATIPVRDLPRRSRRLRGWAAGRGRCAPLGSRRGSDSGGLVGLGMNVLGLRSRSVVLVGTGQLALEQLQTGFDVDVGGIQVCRTTICIESVCDLVVAGFVLDCR